VPNERLRRSRRVGVLALQGDFREHLAALRACEVEGVPIRLASELEAVDALILPGGESTTMAHLMDPALKQSIQQRSAAGMPVMGTCAGMILMAREIQDGRPDQEPLKLMDIGVRRNAYGRQIDSFEA
jgi:5'-phosphate synthase pdxT subunit